VGGTTPQAHKPLESFLKLLENATRQIHWSITIGHGTIGLRRRGLPVRTASRRVLKVACDEVRRHTAAAL